MKGKFGQTAKLSKHYDHDHSLKLDIDKLDINKLEKVPSGLSNWKSKVDKLDVYKLVLVPVDLKIK